MTAHSVLDRQTCFFDCVELFASPTFEISRSIQGHYATALPGLIARIGPLGMMGFKTKLANWTD